MQKIIAISTGKWYRLQFYTSQNGLKGTIDRLMVVKDYIKNECKSTEQILDD